MRFKTKVSGNYTITSQEDWKYFRVSKFPGAPKVTKQDCDPAGIYLFRKGVETSSSILDRSMNAWKYAWEAKLKPGVKVLDLDKVSQPTSEKWLAEVGIKTPEQFLKALEDDCDGATATMLYDSMPSSSGRGSDKEAVLEALETELYWMWFRAIRSVLRDSHKLGNFFASKGYDALYDSGPYIYGDEEQLVVLKDDVAEFREVSPDDLEFTLR